MEIDFDKIRSEAVAKVTSQLEDHGKNALMKVTLAASAKITAEMLKAYHEQLNQAVKQDQPPTSP